ncbi:hypothetical protein TGRH88_040320 [Toxoplasma gondii]|uniref:Uncharacterized protein n=1 Tax=Toxoplasma gondii TaxID=5811 RepID=A0A7J6JZ49_TOXGO|nr:hypothetical protein TGRH88_040320 [Toxoplasma gondii]
MCVETEEEIKRRATSRKTPANSTDLRCVDDAADLSLPPGNRHKTSTCAEKHDRLSGKKLRNPRFHVGDACSN